MKVSTAEKMSKLKWYVGGTMGNSVFVELTVFGTIFVLYMDFLGIDKRQIGILLSMFPFMGVLAVLIAPYVEMFGFKRTFVTFYTIRKLLIGLLLLIPWLMSWGNEQLVFDWIFMVIVLFALSRSIAETGWFPWNQEFMPPKVRGKVTAKSHVAAMLSGLAAIGLGTLVLSWEVSLRSFSWLIGLGVVFGLLSVWAYSHLPSDRSERKLTGWWHRPELGVALRDRLFVRYLVSVCLVILATGPVVGFMPLFFTEQLALATALVVVLQFGVKGGALVSGYLWGWAADRYGSKPILLSALLMILVLLVSLMWLGWAPQALVVASVWVVVIWQGFVFTGWYIGESRMLFNTIVPADRKQDYLSVYYAAIGLAGGMSQILGGWWLDTGINWNWWGMAWSSYTILLLVAGLLLAVAVWGFRGIPDDRALPTREFLRFWVLGNPLYALGSVFRYNFSADEHQLVAVTQSLGSSRSHLTVDELVGALRDPRFNVRYEAVLAMARTRKNPKIVKTLGRVLESDDPAMICVATWALGRIGGDECVELVSSVLDSKYKSVQEYAVRAISYMDVAGYEAAWTELMLVEKAVGLRLAYAAYVGKRAYEPGASQIMQLYRETSRRFGQRELGLALARIWGMEKQWSESLRRLDDDMETELGMLASKIDGSQGEQLGRYLQEEKWMSAVRVMKKMSEDTVEDGFFVERLEAKSDDMVIWSLWLCRRGK